MYDIVFISYNEPRFQSNYMELVTRFPFHRVVLVTGVKGIHQAHIAAASKVNTPMFYVVDADAKLLPDFKFNIKLDPSEEDIVHVWRSRNPVNGLEYGHGGVKLLPTTLTLNMDISNPDMTTSISKRFKVMDQVSNITSFNVDPLCTWRTAFRECAKLSSGILPNQNGDEAIQRLNVWQHNTSSAQFAEYARGGASAGAWFGSTYKDDPTMLAKINDYDWLESEFYGHTSMYPPETFK